MFCHVENCLNNNYGECNVSNDIVINADGTCSMMDISNPERARAPEGLNKLAGWREDCYDCDLWNWTSGCENLKKDGRHICERMTYKAFLHMLKDPQKKPGWPRDCSECELDMGREACTRSEEGRCICECMDYHEYVQSQLPPGVNLDEVVDLAVPDI